MLDPLDFKIRGTMNGIKYPCIVDIKYDGISVHGRSYPAGPTMIIKTESSQYSLGPTMIIKTESSRQYSLDIMPIHSKVEYVEFLAEWIHGEGLNGQLYEIDRTQDKKIKIFDVLKVEHTDMSKLPLIERRQWLLDNVHDEFLVKFTIADTRDQVEEAFKAATAVGYEGLVVKNISESLDRQTWVKQKVRFRAVCPVVKVEQHRFVVDHRGAIVGLKKTFPVTLGERVVIEHNGVIKNSGSLRNPVLIGKFT